MIMVEENLKRWNWWPLFPLYPYGKKKTILRELIPDQNMVFGTNTGTLLCSGSNKNDGNKG